MFKNAIAAPLGVSRRFVDSCHFVHRSLTRDKKPKKGKSKRKPRPVARWKSCGNAWNGHRHCVPGFAVAGAVCMRFLRCRFLRPFLRNSWKYPPAFPRSLWGIYLCVWAIYRENAKLVKTEKRFCLRATYCLKTEKKRKKRKKAKENKKNEKKRKKTKKTEKKNKKKTKKTNKREEWMYE